MLKLSILLIKFWQRVSLPEILFIISSVLWTVLLRVKHIYGADTDSACVRSDWNSRRRRG